MKPNREIKLKSYVKKHDGSIKAFIWNVFKDNAEDAPLLEHDDKILACGLEYTGLKDRNGVEIYEADVIKTPHFTDIDNVTAYLYHRVVFDEKYNAFTVINKHNTDELLTTNGNTFLYVLAKESIFEVCGNIYENPELLK